MNHTLIILLTTLATLAIAVWSVVDLGQGAAQRRQLAARSALAEVERRANSPMARFDVMLRRTDLGKKIEQRLARAGVKVRVATFVLLMAAVSIIAVIFVWRTLAPIFGIAALIGVGLGFFAYLKRQEERRKEAFTAQLPELARVLSNATSAGLALPRRWTWRPTNSTTPRARNCAAPHAPCSSGSRSRPRSATCANGCPPGRSGC